MSIPAKRRTPRPEPVEEHNDERWMASYMDMVTVLMCLFIVLFAMSSVDAGKFDKLSTSLATGFGVTPSKTIDAARGVVVPPQFVGDAGILMPNTGTAVLSNAELATTELDNLEAIRDRVDANITASGLAASAQYDITERGLTIRLVGAETLFTGGSVALSAKAVGVLTAIGSVLATIPNQISVEGHADPNGSSGVFASDWELSSGRATQVVRYFIDHCGVAGARTGAVGYGSSRPLTTDSSPAGRALNRRVEVVVLSTASQDVRALLPGLVAGGSGAGG